MLERAVSYDHLTPESLAHLRNRSTYWGMKALLEMNKEAITRTDDDEGNPKATGRMSLGFYYYEGPGEKPDTAPPEPPAPAS